ncbi:MAG: hypothetical protein ACLUOI_27130 [Eisenbergiella sp.]
MLAASFLGMAIGTGTRIEPVTCAVWARCWDFCCLMYPASGFHGGYRIPGAGVRYAYMMQLQLFIPIIGFIYLVEVSFRNPQVLFSS